jgi:SOS-response transcriptional repressor LexA
MVNAKYNRQEIYKFMVAYCIKSGGLPPTLEEIGENIGGAAKSVVKYHIGKLVDDGLVFRNRSGIAYIVGGTWTPPEGKISRRIPECTLCRDAAVTTVAQIPVCEAHHDEYCAEGKQYLDHRPFYDRLVRAHRARKRSEND